MGKPPVTAPRDRQLAEPEPEGAQETAGTWTMMFWGLLGWSSIKIRISFVGIKPSSQGKSIPLRGPL